MLHNDHGRPEREQGGAFAPPGFSHLVKHLVKILTFCVKILTFASPKKFTPPTKNLVDAHDNDDDEDGELVGKQRRRR